ncbi:MAG: hypothetical protein HFH74_12735, partial [Lachnospiraceae bacterium]|nr:hypothetical protein [Lachnospiraceae bacterium]
MRRQLRKTRQAMAGLLSAILLITSLPQNSMYVYAVEQVENLQTEEMTDEPTGSETEETMDSSMETEEKTDAPTEFETEETMDSSMETEEKTDAPTGSETEETETDNDSNTVETQETEEKTDFQNTDSEETDTQAEGVETEELIEFENGDEQQETEGVKETDLQEKIVTAELIGAYQFGDAPSERTYVSDFSSSLAADIDTLEME